MISLTTSRCTAREIISVYLILTAASACKDNAWAPSGDAERVLSAIRAGGATSIARRIDADASFGRSVIDGIATGDSTWLEVAGRITPASAAAAASMNIALASALPHSPEKVLRVLGPDYPVEEVCSIPFLAPESTLVASYHDRSMAALGKVSDTAIAKTRDECRAALDRGRARRLERIDPAYIIKNKPVPVPRARRR